MSTIRERMAQELRKLILSMVQVQDDPDISPSLVADLGKAIKHLWEASVLLEDDGGPTAEDVAGEVKHAPF